MCFLHYYARATVAKSLRRKGCCAKRVFEKGGPESFRLTGVYLMGTLWRLCRIPLPPSNGISTADRILPYQSYYLRLTTVSYRRQNSTADRILPFQSYYRRLTTVSYRRQNSTVDFHVRGQGPTAEQTSTQRTSII